MLSERSSTHLPPLPSPAIHALLSTPDSRSAARSSQWRGAVAMAMACGSPRRQRSRTARKPKGRPDAMQGVLRLKWRPKLLLLGRRPVRGRWLRSRMAQKRHARARRVCFALSRGRSRRATLQLRERLRSRLPTPQAPSDRSSVADGSLSQRLARLGSIGWPSGGERVTRDLASPCFSRSSRTASSNAGHSLPRRRCGSRRSWRWTTPSEAASRGGRSRWRRVRSGSCSQGYRPERESCS
mmetsp:Transcript_13440/g.44876  ORF Transcript_13440/g.44876 Transcript_13440/m.44876 type:complete len:240 (-) Transcript_13440:248-967(-)